MSGLPKPGLYTQSYRYKGRTYYESRSLDCVRIIDGEPVVFYRNPDMPYRQPFTRVPDYICTPAEFNEWAKGAEFVCY
jgi:hypothetical protein